MQVLEGIVAADLLEQAPAALVVTDADLSVLAWNAAAERLFGWTAEEAIGRDIVSLTVPGKRAGLARQIAERVLDGRPWRGEFPTHRRDGAPVRVTAVCGPLLNASGDVVGLVAAVLDVDDPAPAERERRLELLVQTSEIMAASVEPRAGLQSVARNAAAWLADLIMIDLLADDGSLERVAVAHADPDRAGLAEALRAYPSDPNARHIRHVLDTGQSEVMSNLTDKVLAERLRGQAHVEIVRELDLRSAMIVPLAVRDRVLGLMVLVGGADRSPFAPRDLAAAEDVARRVASALDSVALLRQAQESARVARSLQLITDAALAHLDLDELLPEVLDRVHAELGTDTGAVLLADPTGRELEVRAALGLEAGSGPGTRIRFGEGVAGRIAEAEGPMVFEDLRPHELASRPLRSAGVRTMLGAPLRIGQRMLGVIEVGSVAERRFSRDEVELIRLAADRIALAVDHAHLYEAETVARGRLTLLAEASEVLGESLAYRSALGRLANLVVPWLADWCMIELSDDPLGQPPMVAHANPEKVRLVQELLRRRRSDGAAARVIRSGRAEVWSSATDDVLVETGGDEERAAAVRSLGLHSAMIIPLRSRGRTHGAITLVAAESGRVYDESDLAFAVELARRAATAIDTARLYQDRDQVARTLQRTLLPPTLPDIPLAEIAAVYHPAGEGSEIGGDFYDAFETGDGAWVIAIGDVCGKGPSAAAITGLVRHTLRAAAFRERSPRGVLRGLNRALLRQVQEESFCTVAAARLSIGPAGALLTVCTGGHPSPLVLRAGGAIEEAAVAGTLLGIYDTIDVTDTETMLASGDCVVFYTDGVTEERRDGEQFGEARLHDLLADCDGLSAAGIAERIERAVLEFRPNAPADDVAVLVLKIGHER